MELCGIQKPVMNSIYRQQLLPWGHIFIQHYNIDANLETELESVLHFLCVSFGINFG